jgi:hypothetical protein
MSIPEAIAAAGLMAFIIKIDWALNIYLRYSM